MAIHRLRERLLASTIVAGSVLFATSAIAQNTNPPATTAGADNSAPTAEVVVTGSRISNPNLTAIAPVTVVGAAEVKNQGNIRVEDLLNSLPQVFANEGSTDSNGASGIATVDLRDLGPTRTLVLINGRRLGSGDPTDIASDLNFIPGSLIKRVDVLTGGASATYGSDALAGVVNFVLNTDFEGFQIDAQTSFYNHKNRYGEPDYAADNAARGYMPPKGMTTDGASQTVTATFGAGTQDGRGHFTAYLNWRKVNAVTQGDRDFSYCGFSAETTSSGSPYHTCGGSSTSPFGRFRRTVNTSHTSTPVYSATGSSFTMNPAATPATPGGFGIYKSSRDGYNFNPVNYFQRPDTRYTAGVFANYDVSDSFKPYMEFMFMDDHTRAQIAASGAFYGTDFFINCNNPELTAAQQTQLCAANAGTNQLQSVYIGRRNIEGGGRVDDLRHTDYRGVVGAKGEIADGVTYDVYGSMWKSLLTEEYLNDFSRVKINRSLNVVTGPNGTPVCASAIPNAQGQVVDSACVPWNIFSPGKVTQAALNYLETPGFQHGSNSEYIASGTLSVDLGKHGFQTPWADSGVQAVVGGEYRKEKISLVRDAEFLTGDLAGQGTPFGVPNVHGSYDVTELFTEVSLPLVSDKPGIQTLGFDGAYRYSKYSIQGTTNTFKLSFEYAPVRQVRFRGGFNRAVRAPNTLELFSAPNVILFGGSDPCAGSAPSATLAACQLSGVTAAEYGLIDKNPANQYNQQTAGNINLKPEKSDTVTLGVVLNPIRNFNVTVDAFDIRVKNLISTYGAQFILNHCLSGETQFCSFVHRSAGDGSLWTGASYVANPTLNLGSEKTRGIDVTANYRFNFGKASSLTFDLVGTYLNKFEVTPAPGIASYDCAGAFGFTYCGTPLPEWRHKLRVTYQLNDAISFSGAWRYFSKATNDTMKIDGLKVCPATPTSGACVNPHVARIPAVSYFDLSFAARISDKYTLRLGAQNLLDKQPPVLDSNYTNNGSNVYAQVYDALGRYVYAAIQLNF